MTRNNALGRPLMSAALAIVTLSMVAGCDSSQLDTGYQYRRLGASDSQRRAYYAPEYSREAAMAAQGQQQSGDPSNVGRRRPGTSQY